MRQAPGASLAAGGMQAINHRGAMIPAFEPNPQREHRTGDFPGVSREDDGSSSISADAVEMFETLKRYIGFDEADADNLRRLMAALETSLAPVIESICDKILLFPDARRAFAGDDPRSEKLRHVLDRLVRSLLCGVYDEQYLLRRVKIGQVQVGIELPQHFIVAAMDVIRQGVERAAIAADLPAAGAELCSLRKLLTLESAILLQGYQGTFVQQVREHERSAVHERLTQAEHLAEIGRLAASLAHEIKNPLAGISGAIQVIRDAMDPEAPHRTILGEVLRQINRLDQTVKDLLVYARPVPPRFESCDLGRVIERLMTVLRSEPAVKRVNFQYTANPTPPPTIQADENQIEQLLTNLILNAAHASENGQPVLLSISARPDGVEMNVIDQGHGMDEEARRRALEPFFTTKARGTGLGLPICRRIAEAHGGTLGISGALGEGTTVCVRLPLRQAQPAREWR